MGDLVNLARVRKAEKRIKKAAKAAENVAKYGRTKSQKTNDKLTNLKAVRNLENHRLDHDD